MLVMSRENRQFEKQFLLGGRTERCTRHSIPQSIVSPDGTRTAHTIAQRVSISRYSLYLGIDYIWVYATPYP